MRAEFNSTEMKKRCRRNDVRVSVVYDSCLAFFKMRNLKPTCGRRVMTYFTIYGSGGREWYGICEGNYTNKLHYMRAERRFTELNVKANLGLLL